MSRVVRYSLAYVNPLLESRDNGRVLGYDSAHGRHHRHFRGEVTLVDFAGFEQLEARFQKEYHRLLKEWKYAKD